MSEWLNTKDYFISKSSKKACMLQEFNECLVSKMFG